MRRLRAGRTGWLYALDSGLWAKTDTPRDGASTGRRGRLPYGARLVAHDTANNIGMPRKKNALKFPFDSPPFGARFMCSWNLWVLA